MVTSYKEKLPERLYHYTTTAGFKAIVETKSLHASSIEFLNDRRELRVLDSFLVPRLKARFRQIFLDLRQRKIASASMNVDAVAQHDAETFVRALHTVSSDQAPIFVCSFCRAASKEAEANGLLSQWRGYGADGGIAIEFEFAGLKAITDAENETYQYASISGCDVIYGDSDAEFSEIGKPALEKFASGIPSLIEETLHEAGISYTFPGEKIGIKDLYTPYFSIAPRLKHPGFEEEREFRFIFPVIRGATPPDERRKRKGILFKSRLNYLLPYIVVNEVGLNLPIRRVIVGPSMEAQRRVTSVQMFLREHDLKDVEVTLSAIPFA
jgi:hypothetical protein